MVFKYTVTNQFFNFSDLYHNLGHRAAEQRTSLDVLQAAFVHGVKYQSVVIRIGLVLWVGGC
jgi:hypothetical protein